MMTYHSSDINP